MGLEEGEPVTPVFPNSDYITGVVGVVGILIALMSRAEEEGSWKMDLVLNYYNQWLARSCGTYPEALWEEVCGTGTGGSYSGPSITWAVRFREW